MCIIIWNINYDASFPIFLHIKHVKVEFKITVGTIMNIFDFFFFSTCTEFDLYIKN